MKRPVHSRAIWLGFACACIVISCVGLATYRSTHQLVQSFDSVSESHQAIEKLQSIQELMEAEESSAYRYVITGNEDRLGTYRSARSLLPRKLHDVETLLKSYPRQKKALQEFRQLFSVHQQYLYTIVQVRHDQGYEAASKWVLSEDEHAIREGLNLLLADVQKMQGQVLRQRSASTSEHSLQTTFALIGAAGMSLLLVAGFFGLLRKESGERREVENTNVQLETFLRSIVERIPYMVLVKEATSLRITLANKAATEWLGLSEKELLGSNEYDLRPLESARVAMEQDRDALNKGEPVDIPEERLILKGKDRRILHTQKVAIPDETGAPAFLLTISEDITERKHAERMLEISRDAAIQSEALKSEFMRNMSHEIRTPLSVIVGMITLLLDTELTSDQRHLASKVDKAAVNLARLTKSILDFSKIEAGTFSLELQEMNLRQNIDGILAMHDQQAKTKGVGLVSLVPPTIPQLIVGDPNRLRQVLTELVGNALKFTPRGEIIVRVSQEERADRQLWLTIKVSDTGLGISEEAQKHLFEPFRQGDGSATRVYGGTGLGLAISKRIVELMGGTIGFKSVLNEGSTFWCTIPFKRRRSGDQGLPVASLPWTQTRVLVIDGNEVARKQLREQLTAWSLANEGVANGETALELLRREQKAGRPFPIVLLDMYLADMEAVTVAHAIKTDSALAATQLIVLAETPLDPSTTVSLGFAACLPKSFEPELLHKQLTQLIDPQHTDHQSAA